MQSKSSSERRLAIKTGGQYIDYYDHHFDSLSLHPDAVVWNRNVRRDFPMRRESFLAMEWAGIPCVHWGRVSSLARVHESLVVYTDESMHQGLGKLLLSSEDALRSHSSALCTAYVAPKGELSTSLRRLMIGTRCFEIVYKSRDWRSNYATEEIDVQGETFEAVAIRSMNYLMNIYSSPIFAVDFVEAESGWRATDMNLAPGMRGSGIEDVVSAKTAADLIKSTFWKFEAGRF